jgi:hypothetical protein
MLRYKLENSFPGLFNLIQEPGRWIGEFGPQWFPLSPEKMASESLHVEMVVAPLPFVAAVVRVVCAQCGRSHRIVHVGANFYVMTSHLSAYFAGTGLVPEQLASFIRELASPTPNWQDYPAPNAVPRDVVTSGMVWLLAHEVGHFASPVRQYHPNIDAPPYAVSYLLEELQADYYAFSILMHRVQAKQPMDKRGLSNLMLGVSTILRAWNVTIPNRNGRQASILGYGDRIGVHTPSPTLRWNAMRGVFDTLVRLGMASLEDYQNLEQVLFPDYEAKVDALWRKLHEHGFAF